MRDTALARALFEQSPFSSVLYDAQGHLLAVNAAFERLWGVSAASAPVGYSVLADPELERQGVLPFVRRAFAGEAVVTPPLRYDISRVSATGTGHVLWTQGHFYPLKDETGQVTHVVLTHVDLTERIEIEEALRRRTLDFEAQTEAARALNVALERATSRTGRLQAVTAAFARTLTAGEVARVTLTQGLAALGATAGVVYLMDEAGGVLEAAAWEGLPEAALQQWRRLPLDEPMLVSDAVRAGRPIYEPDRQATVEKYPTAREANRLIAPDAWAAIPLVQDGRCHGALALGFGAGQAFPAEDRLFIEAFATQCAAALERAALFQREAEARAAAEESERRFRRLVEANIIGVAFWDIGGGIIQANDVFLELIGYARADLEAGRIDWRLLTPPEYEAADRRAIEELLATSRHVPYEKEYVRRDGSRVPLLVAAAFFEGSIDKGISFFVDLTEQKRLERELQALLAREREARAEAEAASRAKSEFLATMSHELRTPLNAIDGYAELLEMEVRGPLTDAQREDIARIRRSQKHLLTLINDVLSFARLESGREEFDVQPVLMDDVLRPLEEMIAPQLRAKEIAYAYEPAPVGTRTLADPDKVRQIVLNLLGNAVKFTDHGRVTLRCQADPLGVHVHVQDTGRGIPASQLDAIFEPFVQVERGLTRQVSGSGLGLAIARDLARRMRGDLTVRSTLGQGSTFTLTLPRG